MSPDEVKNARAALGMSQARLATVLGLSERNGRNTVRRWENPESEVDCISGPAALCLRYMLRFGLL
jgi:DNA-binding transcriptional regulator YiaG